MLIWDNYHKLAVDSSPTSLAFHEMSSEQYVLNLITTGPGHLCMFIANIY